MGQEDFTLWIALGHQPDHRLPHLVRHPYGFRQGQRSEKGLVVLLRHAPGLLLTLQGHDYGPRCAECLLAAESEHVVACRYLQRFF